MLRRAVAVLLLLAAAGCTRREAPALDHEAYVWQRRWTPTLSEAVSAPPPELGALRVLARERSGAARAPVDIAVDLAALRRSGREVVAVMRVEGSATLDGVSLAELSALARRWGEAGVRLRGLEIDHDCPTAGLSAYAAWLRRERPHAGGLPVSITALPTWTTSPALPALAASVDGLVLQVHAVRAPVLFDPERAGEDAERFARAAGRPFRLALPTYRLRLKDGTPLAAEPAQVARLLARLAARPIPGLAGLVWFRLGHRGDPDAWSAATLRAVLRREDLSPRLEARLVESPAGARDVVVENLGPVDAPAPARLALLGHLEALEGVRGYAADGAALVAPIPPRVRSGESIVVGFARGKELSVATR